jgi:hypothetical protein
MIDKKNIIMDNVNFKQIEKFSSKRVESEGATTSSGMGTKNQSSIKNQLPI